jgi:dTDP-4-amino-4,6-dideoxygalactose transaminase
MTKTSYNIPLVKPAFPPKAEFFQYIEEIEKSRILTNGGVFESRLESDLCDFLGANYISLMSSGSMALTLGIKALDLKGEIITTAFTSPATLMACYWNNLKPVFADVGFGNANLNPESVKKLIGQQTCAILPVHVYGYPCDIDGFEKLAEEFGLKLIFDAAHCFGANFNNKSLCTYGDMSVLSFHATKVFNTIEGGAVVCSEINLKQKLDVLKNTGISNDLVPSEFGLNAKMSEINASYGLALLPHVKSLIDKRKNAAKIYSELLKNIPGLEVYNFTEANGQNYSYYPVFINENDFGCNADALFLHLKNIGIVTRRYFSPLLTDTALFCNCCSDNLENAKKTARDILCLPLFDRISSNEVELVCSEIISLCKDFK